MKWLAVVLLVVSVAVAGEGVDRAKYPLDKYPPEKYPYSYQGSPRRQSWFLSRWKQCRENIAVIDGKYYEVGASRVAGKPDTWLTAPKPGYAACKALECSKVLDIIGPDEMLVVREAYDDPALKPPRIRAERRPKVRGSAGAHRAELRGSNTTEWARRNTTIVYHAKGIDTKDLADEQSLPKEYTSAKWDAPALVHVGTYTYTDQDEKKRIVQSYRVWHPKPLSKEEFASAVAAGVELVQ